MNNIRTMKRGRGRKVSVIAFCGSLLVLIIGLAGSQTLAKDPGETTNLAKEYPEVVKKLQAPMEELDAEIEENSREPWTQNLNSKK